MSKQKSTTTTILSHSRIRMVRYLLLVLFLFIFTACHTRYLIKQGGTLLRDSIRKQQISDLLQDPGVPYTTKKQFIEIRRIRQFANNKLTLQTGDDYTSYIELDRSQVGWILTATPSTSLKPRSWTFLTRYSFHYLGFFSRRDAEHQQEELMKEGYDTFLQPMQAYSTLGWSGTPVYSTFLSLPEPFLIEIIFHELVHRTMYFPKHPALNEAIATVIARKGTRQYLETQSRLSKWKTYLEQRKKDQKKLRAFFGDLAEKLNNLYQSDRAQSQKLEKKQKIFHRAIRSFIDKRHAFSTTDTTWFLTRHWNNAFVAAHNTYNKYIPLVQSLYEQFSPHINKMVDYLKNLEDQPDPINTIKKKNRKE